MIKETLVLVLLDLTLAYKYKYTNQYIKTQRGIIAKKYQASEWRGGTGDQHLYKAVLPQRMSPEIDPQLKTTYPLLKKKGKKGALLKAELTITNDDKSNGSVNTQVQTSSGFKM